jgi:hypothetical protein
MNVFEKQLIELSGAPLTRWKSHAAEWLGISRPTLVSYLKHAAAADWNQIPIGVLARLGLDKQESQPTTNATLPETNEMLVSFAAGLVEMQAQVDEIGFAQAPYPPHLQRGLDIAAALNFHAESSLPTTLTQLLQVGATPVYKWCPELSGPTADSFYAATLLENNEVTRDCLAIADMAKLDSEHVLYQTLRECCDGMDEVAAQSLYVQWRRTVVEQPVAQGHMHILTRDPIFFANIDAAQRLIDTFYTRLLPIHAVEGKIHLCPLSGTRLRRVGNSWMTELRDPAAQQYLDIHGPMTMEYTPDALEVKRPARLYWTLPGWHELKLAKDAKAMGWEVELWPNLDAIDLSIRKRGNKNRYAVDVKDYLSPLNLARSFQRFNGYKSHTRLIVIPDYLERLSPDYRKHFSRWRSAEGKLSVEIALMSNFIDDLRTSA